MKKLEILVLFLLTFNCCSSQDSRVTTKSFNEESKRFFLSSFDSLNLSPLSDVEKCIIRKTIMNELSDLGDLKVTLIDDRFIVKKYFIAYLNLPFSFIKDEATDHYFFVSLPHLEEYFNNVSKYYERKNDSIYFFSQPIHPIKLNSILFDDFFAQDVFTVNANDARDVFAKFDLAGQILTETYGSLYYHQTSPDEFLDKLKDDFQNGVLEKKYYEEIKKLVDARISLPNYKAETFVIEEFGSLILIYRLDKTQNRVVVEFYIVPESQRRLVSGSGQVTKYKECFIESR